MSNVTKKTPPAKTTGKPAKKPPYSTSNPPPPHWLRDEAMRRFRDEFGDEYERIITAVYAEFGLTYQRRLTPEEREEKARQERVAKARASVEKLVDEFGADVLPVAVQASARLDLEELVFTKEDLEGMGLNPTEGVVPAAFTQRDDGTYSTTWGALVSPARRSS